jgi:hypothetical protein
MTAFDAAVGLNKSRTFFFGAKGQKVKTTSHPSATALSVNWIGAR